jgi:hypothetical protein
MEFMPQQDVTSDCERAEVIRKDREKMRERFEQTKQDYRQLIESARKSIEDTQALLAEFKKKTGRIK